MDHPTGPRGHDGDANLGAVTPGSSPVSSGADRGLADPAAPDQEETAGAPTSAHGCEAPPADGPGKAHEASQPGASAIDDPAGSEPATRGDPRVEDPPSNVDDEPEDDDPPSVRSVVTLVTGARPLARITDPRKLDASGGKRARMRVAVTREWLVAGADLEVLAPRLLACDRCQGGGCDSCERSGALRAPREPEQRLVRLTLPSEHPAPCVVRLVAPFEGSDIEQLLVRIEVSETPSARVRRVLFRQPPPSAAHRAVLPLALAVVVLFAAAIIALLL